MRGGHERGTGRYGGRLRRAVALLALVATLAGCDRGRLPAEEPIVARVAIRDDPLSFDPHVHNEVLTLSVLHHVYEGLTAFGASGRVRPLLAESWTNPDDRTWRLQLRSGVRFHDGSELDAGDVLFSLERARTHPASGFSSLIADVEEIAAPDPSTVVVRTRLPYPVLLNKLAFIAIVPEGSPAEIPRPMGTGPLRWTGSREGESIRFERFEGYWGQSAGADHVEMLVVPDRAERLRMLVDGEVVLAQELDPRIPDGSLPGVRLIARDSLQVEFLGMDPSTPPFDDPRVRRAIDVAIDRDELVREKLGGRGRPLGQMVSVGAFGHRPDLEPPPADPAEALRLLREAGHEDGLELELIYREGREATLLAEQLAEVGLHLVGVELPWAELYPRLFAQRDVPFWLGGIVAISGDASDVLDGMIHSPDPSGSYGTLNALPFADPEVDARIEKAGSTLDVEDRRRWLGEALAASRENRVYVPLYTAFDVFGLREGWRWEPRPGLLIDAVRLVPPDGADGS